jgi:hypothetical protein
VTDQSRLTHHVFLDLNEVEVVLKYLTQGLGLDGRKHYALMRIKPGLAELVTHDEDEGWWEIAPIPASVQAIRHDEHPVDEGGWLASSVIFLPDLTSSAFLHGLILRLSILESGEIQLRDENPNRQLFDHANIPVNRTGESVLVALPGEPGRLVATPRGFLAIPKGLTERFVFRDVGTVRLSTENENAVVSGLCCDNRIVLSGRCSLY